ncbi:hypothetical protein GEMRC1_002632 [Eukaryota sp. GEM-RC1]
MQTPDEFDSPSPPATPVCHERKIPRRPSIISELPEEDLEIDRTMSTDFVEPRRCCREDHFSAPVVKQTKQVTLQSDLLEKKEAISPKWAPCSSLPITQRKVALMTMDTSPYASKPPRAR